MNTGYSRISFSRINHGSLLVLLFLRLSYNISIFNKNIHAFLLVCISNIYLINTMYVYFIRILKLLTSRNTPTRNDSVFYIIAHAPFDKLMLLPA